jgi:hypothetical protein
MLNQPDPPTMTARNPSNERRFWHNGARNTSSLGCTLCPDRKLCGGIQVERALFDCLGLCCRNPENCDAVCRNKPEEFARRVREVAGFSFDNVPRAPVLNPPKLPNLVPIMFHGDRREAMFTAPPAVCLPLYRVIQRHDGSTRHINRRNLAKNYRIPMSMPIILTGTARDASLERWWSLGSQRREVIQALRALDIALVTTPNFSLFIDQPRWDDLHNMKRIALVHEEFLSEGLPAALHVNARTEHDWCRWRDYIAARPEVTHIAFEFATGAGWADRMDWHANQLIQLASAIERPLHLVVRGGGNVLPTLREAFSAITCLETSTFLKTVKRQRATVTASGVVSWHPSPTGRTEMLDALLTSNWEVVAASYDRLFTPGLGRLGVNIN